ncbi:fimbrillin family protein [Bacteroides sp.]|uniref:fimbrillin family protein n=1 Tax=Bacteroides sp. TaxID=29523 RepID=UPI002639D02E|nr:fimbrillin family protein [Bacteroides sp.]MDD3037502.1 fimbrillin family protein [Bacteroides sp.]
MKVFYSRSRGIGLILILPFFITACVNHFSSDKENVVDSESIPLKFTANIHKVVKTRISNNTFDKGDTVGLFALVGSTTLTEERYVDNFLFKRSENDVFETGETVYYPDDGVAVNLISYYPYNKDGIAIGKTTMQVSVETEQELPENYSHSDFLVASSGELQASTAPVALFYNHKFFRLNIVIVPGEGITLEELRDADPQLTVEGFFTKAVYDFQNESYTEYTDEKGVIPMGEWTIKENRLIGKEVILIPQKTKDHYQYITLKVGGKEYRCLLPSTLEMESGKQRELEITFIPVQDVLIGTLNGEIGKWDETGTDQSEAGIVYGCVDISKLTFEESSVYKVMRGRQQVAEICKEYITTSDFASCAIVAYPMKSDYTVDLTKGVVLQLLGHSGNVHGGTVAWNMENHSLVYNPGILELRNYLFVLSGGQNYMSVTPTENLLSVSPDMFCDVRGESIHKYPIVKIGTQYWMRSNLEATRYTNGDAIFELMDMSDGAIGYLSNNGNYFYSPNAVLTNKLLPADWKIPTWNDWDLLKNYLGENRAGSLLKSGNWRLITGGTVLGEATNLSGFNALPVGMWYASGKIADYVGRYSAYWTMDDSGGIPETVMTLKSNSDEISSGNVGADKAYAIRALRN